MSKPEAKKPAATDKAKQKPKEPNKYQNRSGGLSAEISRFFEQIKEMEASGKPEAVVAMEVSKIKQKIDLLNIQKELNDLFGNAKESGALKGEDDGRGGAEFSFKTADEAQDHITEMKALYEKLGFSCDTSWSKDGKTLTLKVHMPKGHTKDPLTMTPEELAAAQEAAKKEKSGAASGVKGEVRFGEAEKPGVNPKPVFAEGLARPKSTEIAV